MPLVTLGYLIAQKLHACTDHSIPEWANDRARDLVDVLLVRRRLADTELAEVRQACVEIFRLREKHAWPPTITVLPAWPQLYRAEVAKIPGFTPTDVDHAADDVAALIAQIDTATD
ncbi:nucleotidyl transferase AbiEii/AbiGii toxin family protein [Solirubrobacter ginsenosidimutans]|uniref:Nucleotidyl transferase AbiEii/AbiGii toxin family protein n=1 Tax=Solirubrobacter ginsenosidimutans TaxID=490573 RepID=A0A9X3MMN8_9ACTN|nr:nucleotidyl transferase AbiEii/AbiGii toxin family protein [Solirubrobacter ginsenosidimutans]MDA0159289.1 nucleotidyl transferase AbiEii/AbiGii toxin family protein [Solirubrobacter ginsenosidimutans]